MKKAIAIMVIVSVLIGASAITSYGASDGFSYKASKSITRFYYKGKCVGKIKTSKRLNVKIVKSEKLTANTLEHRKNNYVVVEVIKGKCLNGKGDGKTANGDYISYSRVKGHKRGIKYTTYCVYANNNSIDDVAFRFDVKRK